MRLCQKLYEKGLITYMRTDSKTYSKDFIETVKEHITENYCARYIIIVFTSYNIKFIKYNL